MGWEVEGLQPYSYWSIADCGFSGGCGLSSGNLVLLLLHDWGQEVGEIRCRQF